MDAAQLLNKKDLSFLNVDTGPKWSESIKRIKASDSDKPLLQALRDTRLTVADISKSTGFSKGFISKNTTPPPPLKNGLGVGELICKIQDGYVFDEELIVTNNKRPIFKLVPIKQDEQNEL